MILEQEFKQLNKREINRLKRFDLIALHIFLIIIL